MRRSKLRRLADRHESPEEMSEVWPAYVDVLAAGFVFVMLVLLAFAYTERQVQQSRDRQRRLRDRAGQLAMDKWRDDVGVWEKKAGDLVDASHASLMSTWSGLPECARSTLQLKELCSRRHDNTNAVRKSGGRIEIDVRCELSEEEIGFESGQWKPKFRSADDEHCLRRAAEVLYGHRCRGSEVAGAWCATGVEVEGHADCRRLTKGGLTNWELSTNRAGAVIKSMMLDRPIAPIRLGAAPDFLVRAAGYEAQQPADLPGAASQVNCDCDGPDDACHRRNRRVILRLKIATAEEFQRIPEQPLNGRP
jgi:hypothetical protein